MNKTEAVEEAIDKVLASHISQAPKILSTLYDAGVSAERERHKENLREAFIYGVNTDGHELKTEEEAIAYFDNWYYDNFATAIQKGQET